MKPKFAISSLIAAGFLAPQTSDAMPIPGKVSMGSAHSTPLFDVFRLEHKYTLAGHRSHSSHSSHSSHRSSGGGGYSYSPLTSTYVAPSTTYSAPVYSPPVTTAPTTTTPAPAKKGPMVLPPLPGNSDKFSAVVMQVQTALLAYGYYSGQVDGIVDAGTRLAIEKYQSDAGLKITGTITPQLLDTLRIVAQ